MLLFLLVTLTGITRTVDADLTAIAQRRAVEISACEPEQCFNHSGWVYGRDGTAEILAWNSALDPVEALARQWQGSADHWAILTDPSITSWGCAVLQVDWRVYGVCTFASSSVVAPAPPVGTEPGPAPPVELLPNTAMRAP